MLVQRKVMLITPASVRSFHTSTLSLAQGGAKGGQPKGTAPKSTPPPSSSTTSTKPPSPSSKPYEEVFFERQKKYFESKLAYLPNDATAKFQRQLFERLAKEKLIVNPQAGHLGKAILNLALKDNPLPKNADKATRDSHIAQALTKTFSENFVEGLLKHGLLKKPSAGEVKQNKITIAPKLLAFIKNMIKGTNAKVLEYWGGAEAYENLLRFAALRHVAGNIYVSLLNYHARRVSSAAAYLKDPNSTPLGKIFNQYKKNRAELLKKYPTLQSLPEWQQKRAKRFGPPEFLLPKPAFQKPEDFFTFLRKRSEKPDTFKVSGTVSKANFLTSGSSGSTFVTSVRNMKELQQQKIIQDLKSFASGCAELGKDFLPPNPTPENKQLNIESLRRALFKSFFSIPALDFIVGLYTEDQNPANLAKICRDTIQRIQRPNYTVHITVADISEVKQFSEMITEILAADDPSIDLRIDVDRSLISGFQLLMGSTFYDYSLKQPFAVIEEGIQHVYEQKVLQIQSIIDTFKKDAEARGIPTSLVEGLPSVTRGQLD